jgi:hypothetical protein
MLYLKSSELVINSPPLSLNPATKNPRGQIPPTPKLPRIFQLLSSVIGTILNHGLAKMLEVIPVPAQSRRLSGTDYLQDLEFFKTNAFRSMMDIWL